MYKVFEKANPTKGQTFTNRGSALRFIQQSKKAKGFYTVKQTRANNPSWQDNVTFDGAVEITRANVKNFYKKSGYIQVTNDKNEVLHIGKTSNMGKVFSNYVNSAKYNQSYDFNLDGTDRLFFKEANLA